MDLVYLAVFAAMAALTGTQLRLCARLFARPPMTALYWLGGLTAALLFAYLAYALFNPEKF